MNLAHGGHLTHGSPVNFSGRLFNIVAYGVDKDTCLIDYEEVRRLAHEHRPAVIVAGASAYPRTIDFAKFRAIADEVDAKLFVDMAHIAGLVAAGLHPTPVGHAHVTTTTTHKTLRGPRGGMILSDESLGKALNSQIFPGIQGGPLMHIVRGQGRGLWRSAAAPFQGLSGAGAQERRDAGRRAQKRQVRSRFPAARTTACRFVDLTSKGITGKDAEHALDDSGHHPAQQEHRAL